MNPLVIDIKRNVLDDGPGIRTLVFLKGCPLSCVWCQNPESQSKNREISFDKNDCLDCYACIETCTSGAIVRSKRKRILREKCDLCGKCIAACKGEALKIIGNEYSVERLFSVILDDKVFYDNSGGGVTFSGGEPALHMHYLNSLLKLLKEAKVRTCMETAGFYDLDRFNALLLPYLELVYFDLKLFDAESHKKYCRVSNETILRNFEDLIINKRVEALPGIPLIPGITLTKKNLCGWADYLKSMNIKRIRLLPYNPLWVSKLGKLGKNSAYRCNRWLNEKDKKMAKDIFKDFEVSGLLHGFSG